MDALALARWQFGITTVYHFLFVPMTIGLIWLVAIMQTKWHNSGNVSWYKLTRLFGKIFLINFAAGVVTGIVQEFQFGMNWSEYSRFVGDIFGAPLALEALIAFFMESTFVGLWIFGWNKLPKKVHLAMVYLTAAGTTISSIFILAANSFMQNPVGATFNPETGRAELVNMLDLVTNPFFLVTFPHVLAASFMLAGGMVVAAAGWWFAKTRPAMQAAAKKDAAADAQVAEDHSTWRTATRFGAWFVLVASAVSILSGHFQGQVEAKYQPLKLAASEGLTDKSYPNGHAPFAVLGFFNADGTKTTAVIELPSVLSMLVDYKPSTPVLGQVDLVTKFQTCTATNPLSGTSTDYLVPVDDGTVPLNQLQKDVIAKAKCTPITNLATIEAISMPNLWVTFYSFRLMILAGFVMLAFSIIILAKTKPSANLKGGKAWTALMISMPLIPLVASAAGWILTEMGRQPWIVYGVLPTTAAVSPTVAGGEVLVSMILYTAIYAVVAVIVVSLFLKTIRQGLPDAEAASSATSGDDDDAVLHFAY